MKVTLTYLKNLTIKIIQIVKFYFISNKSNYKLILKFLFSVLLIYYYSTLTINLIFLYFILCYCIFILYFYLKIFNNKLNKITLRHKRVNNFNDNKFILFKNNLFNLYYSTLIILFYFIFKQNGLHYLLEGNIYFFYLIFTIFLIYFILFSNIFTLKLFKLFLILQKNIKLFNNLNLFSSLQNDNLYKNNFIN